MKSGFIRRIAAQPPLLDAEPPYMQHAFGVRQLAPEFEIVAIGVRSRLESPDDHGRAALGRRVSTHSHILRANGTGTAPVD
jgi:hypothetical protein